jgi:MFS family permease
MTMSTLTAERPVAAPKAQRNLGWILAAVGIPVFMVTLDNLVVTTALPVIRTSLGASITDLQWFVNAYTLPFAAFLLTAAALGDRIGRRRMFIAGIVVFTLASAAAAIAVEPWQLIAARSVQGLAGAAVAPLSLTLLAQAVPDRMRTMAPMVVAPLAGIFADRLGLRNLIVAGQVSLAAGVFWIAVATTTTVDYSDLVIAFVLAGIGMGLTFAPISTMALASAEENFRGVASGATNTIRELGVAVGVAVLASVFSSNGGYTSRESFVYGIVPAVMVGAVIIAAGAVIAGFLPGRRSARQ